MSIGVDDEGAGSDAGGAASVESGGRFGELRRRAESANKRLHHRLETQARLQFPVAVLARYTARQGVLLASATAFRLFLWLVPLALLIAGVLAALAVGHEIDLRSAVKTAGITGAASQHVVSALRDGNRSWVAAVAFGLVLFVWATRALTRTLAIVSAHAWQEPLPKRRAGNVLRTTLLLDAVWIVVLAGSAGSWELQKFGVGGAVLAVIGHGLLAAGAWFAISRRLPNRAASWLDLIPGSLLFGYSFAVLNEVSRLYIPSRVQASSELYGSLGLAVTMLAWLLILGQITVLSAITNSVWAERRLA
jgi:membrane protein